LPHYPDPLAFIDRQRENALHLAVRFAKVDMVELICNHIRIIKHFGFCTIRNKTGARSGPSCLCPIVYPRLEDADRSGYTALHLGVMYQNPKAGSFLLQCSKLLADLPMSNFVPLKNGGERIPWTTSLHYAVRNEKTLGDMFKVLIDGGADINSVDSHGRSPLTVAKQCGSSKAITFLGSHGALTLPPERSTNGIRRRLADRLS
jgi:ankyrin repeat protein